MSQQTWLKMMESIQKDVECTFGILKGRFCILKTGIRVHSLKTADQIWKTCCALHNWLLEMDGLDERFELDGTTSEWEDPLGLNDIDDFQNLSPAAKWGHVGNEAHAIHHYDESQLGQDLPREMVLAEDVFEDDSSEFDYDITIFDSKGATNSLSSNDNGNVHIVRELDFEFFRSKLVEHFDILYKEHRIVWPKRTNAT